jgi:hypothetical protein
MLLFGGPSLSQEDISTYIDSYLHEDDFQRQNEILEALELPKETEPVDEGTLALVKR